MSVHDAVLSHQRKLVALIDRAPNKRAACRQAGIHHSTYYRWRAKARSQTPVGIPRRRWRDLRTDAAVVAMALAHPGLGPIQLAKELADHGEVEMSPSTVWRILCHHRLNTARLRYDLMALRPSPSLERPPPPPVGSLDASVPGDLVQMDCFHVGSFKETRLGVGKARPGTVWQYTAIDVASSFLWAELHASSHNPDPTHTSALAYRVAQDLRSWGWEPRAISTDNGNEFRAGAFREAVAEAGIAHRFIRAGRPQSNGKVERVQGTLLTEFYQPVLSRYVEPSITGLRRDLEDYVRYYNWQRAHSGKWNKGRTPAEIISPKEKLIP